MNDRNISKPCEKIKCHALKNKFYVYLYEKPWIFNQNLRKLATRFILSTNSSIKSFADNISLYSQVSCSDDCFKLQDDLLCVYQWSLKWQLKLNPKKCDAINISNKRSPINFDYLVHFCGPRKLSISWCCYKLQA